MPICSFDFTFQGHMAHRVVEKAAQIVNRSTMREKQPTKIDITKSRTLSRTYEALKK